MSEVEWLRIAKLNFARLQVMTPAQKWRHWLLDLVDAPYVWGKENPLETDCSGTVCFALWMMGYNIRTTADRLYRAVFTKPLLTLGDLDILGAIFYLRDGAAKHVTPLVGQESLLDASGKDGLVIIKPARKVFEQRLADGYQVRWQQIDWEATKKLSASGSEAWDVDPVLTREQGEGSCDYRISRS